MKHAQVDGYVHAQATAALHRCMSVAELQMQVVVRMQTLACTADAPMHHGSPPPEVRALAGRCYASPVAALQQNQRRHKLCDLNYLASDAMCCPTSQPAERGMVPPVLTIADGVIHHESERVGGCQVPPSAPE
jgi:hypothetical protein